jgi:deoxyribodipyrimidine photo-lyase
VRVEARAGGLGRDPCGAVRGGSACRPDQVPFWTVDADVIVPSVLLEGECAARTIRPRIHRQLEWPGRLPRAGGARALEGAARLHALEPGWTCLRASRSIGGRPVAGSAADEGSVSCAGFWPSGYTTRSGITRAERHEPARLIALRPSRAARWRWRFVTLRPTRRSPGVSREFIVRRELAVNFVASARATTALRCEPGARHPARHHRDRRPHLYSARQLDDQTHDQLGTRPRSRWSRPAGCTATCGCTGRRRSWSGHGRRKRRSRSPLS